MLCRRAATGGAALDGDAVPAQPLFPRRQLVGRDRESAMQGPVSVMGAEWCRPAGGTVSGSRLCRNSRRTLLPPTS